MRAFHMAPCPVCEKDTLFISMKCSECGHILVSGRQTYKDRLRGIVKSPERRIRIARQVSATRSARKQEVLRRSQIPGRGPRRGASVFGSGRAKQRV